MAAPPLSARAARHASGAPAAAAPGSAPPAPRVWSPIAPCAGSRARESNSYFD